MSAQRSTDSTLRFVMVILALLLLAPMLMMAVAFPMMGAWGGMMGGFDGGLSPLWGVAMSVVWLVVLVVAGYLLYRWLADAGAVAPDPALEELRLAYARGDLTEEEYDERRSKLERE